MNASNNVLQTIGRDIKRFARAKYDAFGFAARSAAWASEAEEGCFRMPGRTSLLSLLGIGLDAITAKAATPAWASPQQLHALGVISPEKLDRICADQCNTKFLVQDFLPLKSIAIAAGESTIGKSALICQLALCIASGKPFFGMPTDPGRVLYFDLENSALNCQSMRDSLMGFLGIDQPLRDFYLVTEPREDWERLLEGIQPSLVVIDSLRSFRPEVAGKNPVAGEWLKEIRRLSRKYECTFLIVHHLRKPAREIAAHDLDSCNVVTWLQEMEGARALVNQTDIRIAIAGGDSNPAALKVKWSRRTVGDAPVVLAERIFDEDGEPAGYRHMTGALLLNKEKREVFDALPEEFCTADAKEKRNECGLGDGNDPTNKYLAECRQLRIIQNVGRGRWKKVAA